jgi:hypothetical protein
MKYMLILITIIITTNAVIPFEFSGKVELKAIYSEDKDNYLVLKNAKINVTLEQNVIKLCFLSDLEKTIPFFQAYGARNFNGCSCVPKYLCDNSVKRCYIITSTAEVIMISLDHNNNEILNLSNESRATHIIMLKRDLLSFAPSQDWSRLRSEKILFLSLRLYFGQCYRKDINKNLKQIETYFREPDNYINTLNLIFKKAYQVEEWEIQNIYAETFLIILRDKLGFFHKIIVEDKSDQPVDSKIIHELEKNIAVEMKRRKPERDAIEQEIRVITVDEIKNDEKRQKEGEQGEQEEEAENGNEPEKEKQRISRRYIDSITKKLDLLTNIAETGIANGISDKGAMVILLRVFWTEFTRYVSNNAINEFLFASFISKAIFCQNEASGIFNILNGKSTHLEAKQSSACPGYEKELYYLSHIWDFKGKVIAYLNSSLRKQFNFLIVEVKPRHKKFK